MTAHKDFKQPLPDFPWSFFQLPNSLQPVILSIKNVLLPLHNILPAQKNVLLPLHNILLAQKNVLLPLRNVLEFLQMHIPSFIPLNKPVGSEINSQTNHRRA